jgi:hypothetical protein
MQLEFLNDLTPVLVNNNTLIVYVDIDQRRRGIVQGLAYYVQAGVIMSIGVDYRWLKPLNDPHESEYALYWISRCLKEALDEKDRNDKEISKIDESLKFLKKEFNEKGPILTVPLHFQKRFVGYLNGKNLIRARSGRYAIARNVNLSGIFQLYDHDEKDVVFRHNNKMKVIKKLLEKDIKSLKLINETLFNNICCWQNNLKIIKEGAYNPPFLEK